MIRRDQQEKKKLVKEARKTKDMDQVKLVEYLIKENKSRFSSNKAGRDYEAKLAHSMARYQLKAESRQNLFAIVMPAGHGKSTLAHKYGLVDVDNLVTSEEHEYFTSVRAAIMAGKDTWSRHNTEWFDRLNKSLDLMDYSRPVVIMLHHEEIAHEVGAIILGAIKLDKDTFEANISKRDKLSKFFSEQSYREFSVSSMVANLFNVKGNDKVEEKFIDIMNANGLAVACPAKFSRRYTNPHYSQTVPGWVLRGEKTGDEANIKELVDMYEVGMIPKECVDFYVRSGFSVTQLDFGVTMYEWTDLVAQVARGQNDPSDFDPNDDLATVFPGRSAKEISRANVTLRRLDRTFDIFKYNDANYIARHHVGAPHVFVSSIISAWKGILQFTTPCHLLLPWFRTHFNHWPKCFKGLHSLIRTSRFFMNTEITEKDRQSLMYMDLLVGRAEYVIDEYKEVKTRGKFHDYRSRHLSYDPVKDQFTNEQYLTDFKDAIHMAYSRMRVSPRKINLQSFNDFYERRRSWLTKGSLVYNKLPPSMKKTSIQVMDAVKATVDIIESRHNKMSLLEVEDLWTILRTGREQDFNTTKTMIKYETGGKERVLLPGSLIHFLVFTYVLELAEKQEQVGSVRLNAMRDEDIRYFDRKMTNGLYHVLYDWADFNEQHSADELAAVIQGLSDSVSAPDDYHIFANAILQSMYDMQLEDRDGNRHKLWLGLFSGWRGTTWMNTVLNFCYIYICILNYERIYKKNCVIMVDHGGDDMDLMLSDPKAMTKILKIMDDMLFNANAWKQMLSMRSEFFRNTISGGVAYASPTRALASFIAGDWEGSGNATVRERVTSLLDQAGKMKRRGVSAEMCQGLTMCAISHWCKIKDGDEWLNLPDVVMHGREVDGGLGIPDTNNQVWELETPVPRVNEEWFSVIVPDYKASKDYVGVLERELDRFELEITRREDLAQKMAKDSFDVEKKIDYAAWAKLLGFKSRVVAFHDVIEEKHDMLLFEDFMEFDNSDELMEKYDSAGRYQELIGYIASNGKEISKEELVKLMSHGEVRIESIDFSGDIYYRRLVPEFMGLRITYYCKEAINQGVSVAATEEAFKILCYMCKDVFEHRM